MISELHKEANKRRAGWTSSLLSPPYDFPPRPSIALSLFRQCLNEAGMRSQVFYPMFRLSHLLGLEAAGKIDAFPYTSGLQEYLFAHMTDVENTCSDERFARLLCRDYPVYPLDEILALIQYARDEGPLVRGRAGGGDRVRIRPGVLAVSSIFRRSSGRSPSSGASRSLRRILRPSSAVPMCPVRRGRRCCAIIPAWTMSSSAKGTRCLPAAPYRQWARRPGPCPTAVTGAGEIPPDPILHRMTQDMNKVCYPDYSDFIGAWVSRRENSAHPCSGAEFRGDNKRLLYLGAQTMRYLRFPARLLVGTEAPVQLVLTGAKTSTASKRAAASGR